MQHVLKNHLQAFFWVLIFFLSALIVFWIDLSLPNKPWFLAYLGFILALAVFAAVDFFRKPNFIISLGAINDKPDGSWRLLHVNVVNLDWPRWFFLFRRDLARNTSAEIVFKEKDSNKTIFSMSGRWSNNLEPIVTQLNSRADDNQKFSALYFYNEELARRGSMMDLSSSSGPKDLREGKLVVAFKSKDESSCYGFNNYSYNPAEWEHDRQFRTLSQKLERGVYDVEVIIRSGRVISRKVFALENLGDTLNAFQLKTSSNC